MTTNQTIDGVPRAALMTVLSEPRPGAPHCVLEARAVLCALLGAPAATGRQEPKGAILRFREYVGKGQGGRDLWHDWTEWSTGTVEYAKSKLDQVKDLTNVQFEVEWLYAEQPAPVAVVMPGRMEPVKDPKSYDDPRFADDYGDGWNACLDELKRLNNTRPAHANPPPGAEPCGTHHDNDGLDDWRKP